MLYISVLTSKTIFFSGMLNKLLVSGDPALEPLVITEDKAISIGRDHIKTPQALANLFCSQLYRLNQYRLFSNNVIDCKKNLAMLVVS